MKVRCIDATHNNTLTKSKIYEVIKNDSRIGMYTIINDFGEKTNCAYERFEIVEGKKEKRKKVKKYCKNTSCLKCCLMQWKGEHKRNCSNECLSISIATEEELDKALELINSDNHLEKSTNKVADTVKEQVKDSLYTSNKPIEKNKIERHKVLCQKLNALYEAKNADYGDSFGKSYKEYGLTMACIRLEDKLNRLKNLNFSKAQKVNDETLEDTLMDLANYSIMTLIEMGEKENEIN